MTVCRDINKINVDITLKIYNIVPHFRVITTIG